MLRWFSGLWDALMSLLVVGLVLTVALVLHQSTSATGMPGLPGGGTGQGSGTPFGQPNGKGPGATDPTSPFII